MGLLFAPHCDWSNRSGFDRPTRGGKGECGCFGMGVQTFKSKPRIRRWSHLRDWVNCVVVREQCLIHKLRAMSSFLIHFGDQAPFYRDSESPKPLYGQQPRNCGIHSPAIPCEPTRQSFIIDIRGRALRNRHAI